MARTCVDNCTGCRSGCIAATLAAGLAVHPVMARQPSSPDQVDSLLTSAGAIAVVRVARGLEHPWGMAFLPDGRALITERPGRLRILSSDGALAPAIEGVPEVFAKGQGGLLDVGLDPHFKTNRFVYLSYAKPGPEGKAATALGRGKFTEDDRLGDFTDIFVQEPWIEGSKHFGNRMVFTSDNMLFLALGERFQFDPAQDLSTHLGKVIRIHCDGSVPEDNPFVDQEDAKAEIWTLGHRNIESAALHPETDELWIVEMGPLGGDELNRPQAGRNYGWPEVSWGIDYNGDEIPDPPTRPEFADAVRHWSPVISPSGMIFYTGDVFKPWRNDAFVGGLSSRDLVRLRIKDGAVTEEERLPLPARIREVEQGPEGRLYLLTDDKDGQVWRIQPLNP